MDNPRTDTLPLVSFVLLTYNQERYVGEAATAAFNQDYSPLEIIISDDSSSDSTFTVIESLAGNYKGPHTVSVSRNRENLGLAQHFNSLLARSRGEVVVVAAGDDISLPNRVSKTVELLAAHPNAVMAAFTDDIIDANGRVVISAPVSPAWSHRTASLVSFLARRSTKASGASRGFRRRVFSAFGELNPSCPTEDSPYFLRALMLGDVVVSSSPGIRYRKHENNLSRASSLNSMPLHFITEQYRRDIRHAMLKGIINDHMADELMQWVEANHSRRRVAAGLANASNKYLYFVLNVLFNNCFGVRERLMMLRRAAKSSHCMH